MPGDVGVSGYAWPTRAEVRRPRRRVRRPALPMDCLYVLSRPPAGRGPWTKRSGPWLSRGVKSSTAPAFRILETSSRKRDTSRAGRGRGTLSTEVSPPVSALAVTWQRCCCEWKRKAYRNLDVKHLRVVTAHLSGERSHHSAVRVDRRWRPDDLGTSPREKVAGLIGP